MLLSRASEPGLGDSDAEDISGPDSVDRAGPHNGSQVPHLKVLDSVKAASVGGRAFREDTVYTGVRGTSCSAPCTVQFVSANAHVAEEAGFRYRRVVPLQCQAVHFSSRSPSDTRCPCNPELIPTVVTVGFRYRRVVPLQCQAVHFSSRSPSDTRCPCNPELIPTVVTVGVAAPGEALGRPIVFTMASPRLATVLSRVDLVLEPVSTFCYEQRLAIRVLLGNANETL
ncbi:hypothetical protein TREES_T100015887 [Tupaia chinensis]|uniref:Uncharacterized protein n=1 Tax=Tupaia chinensis TaxID=246437 RepID=L9KWR8_TUPCH|nr:hypothetical protein TREES_T100015887 [Tupaia chinensis]